jgi:hypothetical protein
MPVSVRATLVGGQLAHQAAGTERAGAA